MNGGLTDGNRQRCGEAARPLLQAVETLTTFAASPEFSSTPASISAQVDNIIVQSLYVFTSTKEVMFSSSLVSLFVSRITQNLS